MQKKKHDYSLLKKNPHYGKGLHVLCDGGGTPNYPCYYSFRILDTPFWIKRRPLDENIIPKGIVWKQTNNSAELASVYYTLKFIRKVFGPVNLVLFHDSKFAINICGGIKSTEKDWLLTWRNAIKDIWWPSIWHTWIPGKVMKNEHYLNH